MHKNKFGFCPIFILVLGLCANLGASDRNVPFQHNQSRMNRLHSVPNETKPLLPPDFKLPGEAQKPCQTSAEAGTGAISGHVTKAVGGAAIQGVKVYTDLQVCPYYSAFATTGSDGYYIIAGLPAGKYMVWTTNDSDFVDLYWNNKLSWQTPDTVVVVSNDTAEGKDFSLQVGGKITGTVTLSGAFYVSAAIYAIDTTHKATYYSSAFGVGSSVDYSVKKLHAGTYKLRTMNAMGYVDVYYNDKSSWATADPVPVTLGSTTSNKNFTLSLGGTIQGLVDCFDTTLTDVLVYGLYVPDPEWLSYGFTDENGDYTLTGLRSGNWKIIASGDTTYAFQWYWYTDTWSSADIVNITAPETTIDINFSLDPGGSISGHVYDLGGNPLSGCDMSACDSSFFLWGMIVKDDTTSSDGSYKITGLGTGDYYVEASTECYYQYYNHTTDILSAELVGVTRPNNVSGIDFNIASAVGDEEDATPSLPNEFELSQNYPNPFNPLTEIEYSLLKPAVVTVQIYNLLGQEVRMLVNERQATGSHSVFWDGKNEQGKSVSSGIYFYRLTVNGVSQTKRMVLLK